MGTVRSYELDGFRVDAARRELLTASGERPELPSRAYDALVYLIERRGEDVSRDALMQVVWPNTVVDDNNLNQLISDLRRAFGDSRSQPRYIATVPGRGYRFVGKVRESGRGPARKVGWPLAVGIVAAIALTSLVIWLRSDAPPAPLADRVSAPS